MCQANKTKVHLAGAHTYLGQGLRNKLKNRNRKLQRCFFIKK